MERFTALRDQLQQEVESYKLLQADLAKTQQAIKQFTQQQSECNMVKQEFDLLEEGNHVYKLVGPVLVKHDLLEAQSNVNKRLEFINSELQRLEGSLSAMQDKKAKKENEIMRIQTTLQRAQASQA